MSTNTTTTVTFRSFTKADWRLFSGAEDIAPGVSPMIAETAAALYVLAGSRIEAYFGEDAEGFYHLCPSALTSYPLTPAAALAAGWTKI